jgi:HSP20 family protein
MSDDTKRDDERPARLELFDRFDRMFGDWMSSLPFRRALENWDDERAQMIRVEEFEEDGAVVVRAELPGVDPAEDIDVTVSGGALRITAERNQEERSEERGYVRKELRYGRFSRTVPLPEGAAEADVTATYTNGILEVRVPLSTPKPPPTAQISSRRSAPWSGASVWTRGPAPRGCRSCTWRSRPPQPRPGSGTVRLKRP